MQKDSTEKVEAWTSRDGEIWKRGSDSVVTLALFTAAVGLSRPRSDDTRWAQAEGRRVRARGGAGPGWIQVPPPRV